MQVMKVNEANIRRINNFFEILSCSTGQYLSIKENYINIYIYI